MIEVEQAPSQRKDLRSWIPSCSLQDSQDLCDRLESGKVYCDRRASAQAQFRAICCRLTIAVSGIGQVELYLAVNSELSSEIPKRLGDLKRPCKNMAS